MAFRTARAGLTLILGLFIVSIYRVTHRGLNYERSFLVTMLMMSPTVAEAATQKALERKARAHGWKH